MQGAPPGLKKKMSRMFWGAPQKGKRQERKDLGGFAKKYLQSTNPTGQKKKNRPPRRDRGLPLRRGPPQMVSQKINVPLGRKRQAKYKVFSSNISSPQNTEGGREGKRENGRKTKKRERETKRKGKRKLKKKKKERPRSSPRPLSRRMCVAQRAGPLPGEET